MSTGKKLILVLVAVLALGLIGLGIFWGIQSNNQKIYTEKIAAGDRYYIEGDYVSAVAAYEAAIRANPTEEGGYISLARAYSSQGMNLLAIATLERGAGKARETLMINQLLALYKDTGNAEKNDNKNKKNIDLNAEILRLIGVSSYGDYTKQYNLDSVTTEGNGAAARFNGLNATLYFENTQLQTSAVKSGSVNRAALPVRLVFDDVRTLLGIDLPIQFEALQAAGLERLEITTHESAGTVVRFYADGCIVTIASDANGNISKGAWNEVVPELIETFVLTDNEAAKPAEEDVYVEVSGTVIDASTGMPVEGMLVSFYEESDSISPEVEVETDSDGEYIVQLVGSEYTIRLTHEDYEDAEDTLSLGSYAKSETMDFTVSKKLAEGEIRIVLEWGSIPADLDSHLEGWTDAGANVNVYFGNPVCTHNGTDVVTLDLDDIDGHGPETTTIYDMAGVYKFYVHDFRSTGLIEESEATVTVYMPGEGAETYTLSDGTIDGYFWHVFTIDHGVLTVD